MAAATDSTANHHSSCDAMSSPQSRRKSLPSPWAQVVRGEQESMSTVQKSPPSAVTVSSEQAPFSDCSAANVASSSPPPENLVSSDNCESNNDNAAARPKKQAWNKPLNGIVQSGPVMGGVSWPALSESARASPKSSGDSSFKIVSDGSVSTSQVPVIPNSAQKQSTSENPNLTPTRATPGRQRTSKRGGGGTSSGGPGQGGFTHPHPQPRPRPPPPPPLPPFPGLEILPNVYGSYAPAMPDPSLREPQFRGGAWEHRSVGGFVPQAQTMGDHRHSSRRGNHGPRGDGGYHHTFGGRRDQDRGNYGNARDVNIQSHRANPRGFVRPAPPAAPSYFPQQPMRPFPNHLGYSEFIYMPTMPLEPFRNMPVIGPPPPPAVVTHVPEPLQNLIVRQIDYYFSDVNLVKDDFLKSNMDDEGWVPISLIAGFPRVKSLTTNIQLILDSLRGSDVVEVQDDRVRRRNEWMLWTQRSSNELGMPSPVGSSADTLTTALQTMAVDKDAIGESSKPNEANTDSLNASEKDALELSEQSLISNGELSGNTST